MSSLTLSNSAIRGMVGRRQISCALRAKPNSLRLPPGQYALIPGSQSPIYGTVLVLVPANDATASGMMKSNPLSDKNVKIAPTSNGYFKIDYTIVSNKMDFSRVTNKMDFSRVGHYTKVDIAKDNFGNAVFKIVDKSAVPSDFFLSALAVASKEIGSGPCLVVEQGFSDLIDSVGTSGIAVSVG